MIVEWVPDARKDLQRLDRKTQERIRQAVDRLATTGHGDVRRVKEAPGEHALRVGEWRIFYELIAKVTDGKEDQPPQKIAIMRVLRVRSRGHAYGR